MNERVAVKMRIEKVLPGMIPDVSLIHPVKVRPGDSLSIDYKFNIEYWGGVEKRLQALTRLLNSADKKTIFFEVLTSQRSVINDLLVGIDRLIAMK